MSIILNPKQGYVPELAKTDNYREIGSKMAQAFLTNATWDKAGNVELLRNRIVTETGDKKEILNTPIYRGTVNGRSVGLLIGPVKSPLRMFATKNDEAFAALMQEVIKNHGFLNEQIDRVGDIYTDNNAKALYSWEAHFFGEGKSLHKIAKVASVSIVKARKAVEGTNSEFMTEQEATKLVSDLAKKYGVFNLELTWFPWDGMLFGAVSPSEDGVLPFMKPVGVKMRLAKDVVYKHTILHEMAHAIEMFREGVSAHGSGFRKIYRQLIKENTKLNPVGL